jgi:hypothetical protein
VVDDVAAERARPRLDDPLEERRDSLHRRDLGIGNGADQRARSRRGMAAIAAVVSAKRTTTEL